MLQVVEVAGDVLERGVRHPRAPRDVEGAQLPEVLGDQLDAVVSDLRTAGQGEDGQVREGVD